MSTLQTTNLKHPDSSGTQVTFTSGGDTTVAGSTTFSSPIKASKIENASTTDGGVAVDTAGHVQIDGKNFPTAGPLSNRNLIVNGAMAIAQRQISGTFTGVGSLDRYHVDNNSGNWTFGRENLTSGSPYEEGFKYFARLQNTAVSTDNGRRRRFYNTIEAQDIAQSGWNFTSSTSYVTFSFWVRSSVAGTYYFTIQSRDNTPTNRSFTFGETLAANTWTKVEKTIPGDSALVFNNDNGPGLRVIFSVDHGTTFTESQTLDEWLNFNNNERTPDTTTGWSNTLNSTFDVTGVQLEVGEKATPFEHRTFADDLAACQRYCFQLDSTSAAMPVCTGIMWNANVFIGVMHLPVSLRDENDIDVEISTAGDFVVLANDTSKTVSSLSQNAHHQSNILELHLSTDGNLTQGHAAFVRISTGTGKFFRVVSELD